MVRSVSLKLFVVCASVLGLAAIGSAQELPGTSPIAQPNPTVQPATLSDEVLEHSFASIDPQYHKEVKPDGSKWYTFYVTRISGVRLQTLVILTPGKLTVVAKVKDAFVPSLPLEEVNRNLGETNEKLQLAPVYLFATAIENNQAVFLAGQEIDRSVSNDTFFQQWANFFTTAEKLHDACRP